MTVYMEVLKRVGEGKRLKELGQSASASEHHGHVEAHVPEVKVL